MHVLIDKEAMVYDYNEFKASYIGTAEESSFSLGNLESNEFCVMIH